MGGRLASARRGHATIQRVPNAPLTGHLERFGVDPPDGYDWDDRSPELLQQSCSLRRSLDIMGADASSYLGQNVNVRIVLSSASGKDDVCEQHRVALGVGQAVFLNCRIEQVG